MEIIEGVSVFAQWLFFTSLKATIVIALIMIIRLILRDRLPAKWQHALWFLLMARLVLPIDVPAPFSLFNLTERVPYRPMPPAYFQANYTPPPVEQKPAITFETIQQTEASASGNEVVVQSYSLSLKELNSLIWLGGLIFLLLYATGINIATWLRFRKAARLVDNRLTAILNKCQRKLGVQRHIQLFSIKKSTSPFWFGYFRPRIYFPAALVNSLSDHDLEHIFLHELAHFKRRDIVVAMLQTILQAAHWFNPLIWYAFHKMRNDRETACDEMVLKTLGQNRSEAYGQTLISLLRYANRSGLLPVTVGLADSRENIKQRIHRIANFSTTSKWWEVFMVVVVFVIALLALTSATESASVSGEVTLQDGARPDTIYVGLYDFNWQHNIRTEYTLDGTPEKYTPTLALEKLAGTNRFTFDAEQGIYTLVVWAFGYERATYKVFLKDDKTRLDIDFVLARQALPEKISHVTLVGDYCRWALNYVTPLTRDGDVWRTDSPPYMKMGEKYRFLLWEEKVPDFYTYAWDANDNILSRYALNTNARVNTGMATFDHVYAGEKETVFDAAKFSHSTTEAIIQTHGCELAAQFDRLYHDRDHFAWDVCQKPQPRFQALDAETRFSVLIAKLDSLAALYDPYFKDVFIEEKLELYGSFGFNRKDGFFIVLKDNATTAEREAFYSSPAFDKHFADMVALVKQLDPQGPFYYARFFQLLLWYIPDILEEWPPLAQKYNISAQECQNILDNFALHGVSKIAQQSILFYVLQDTYVNRHDNRGGESPERTKKYEKTLAREFADGWAIKSLDNLKIRLADMSETKH